MTNTHDDTSLAETGIHSEDTSLAKTGNERFELLVRVVSNEVDTTYRSSLMRSCKHVDGSSLHAEQYKAAT